MNLFSEPPPMLTFLILGAVSAGALFNVWVWLHRRHDTLHLWAAAWCAVTGSYLLSHYVQAWSEAPERIVLSTRASWVCALLIVLVLVGLTQTLVRGRCSRRSIALVGGLSATMSLIAMLTNLIVTDRIFERTDRLGGQYWTAVPGPLMPYLAPCIFATFIYCFTTVWRAKQLDRGERRAFLVSFSAYIGAGLNDSLHAAQYIRSVRLFDYACLAVALGLTYLVVRRYTRLSDGLETEVAAQTLSLQTRQEHLGALVRAGQVVMAGLDLTQILTRLMEEASRISGAPHVAVLLRDGDSRTFRLAASTGGTFPPGYKIEAGQSISGQVAERGEAIYVADVAADPRNTHPERDRAAGIVAYLGLPIKKADTVLGVIVLKTIAPRTFDPDELAILTSFAQQAGIAIEHARLYSTLEDRVKRLDTLTGLNRLISDSLDVDHILKQIANAAAALVKAGFVIVWSADEGRQVMQARATSDNPTLSPYPHPTRRFGEGGVMGWVAQNRRPLSTPDLAADPLVGSNQWYATNGFQSGASLPILRGSELLGGLTLLFRDALPPNLEDDPLLQAFIDQAGIAIEHARLYSHLEEHVHHLQTVTRLNRLISSSLESGQVLREITQAAAQLPGAAVASIWLANEETRSLEAGNMSDPVMEADWPRRILGFDEGVVGWVARHGRLLNVPDVFKDDRIMTLEWWRRHGLRSFLGLPVIVDGVLIAVLALNGREPFQLDPEAERLLESFGDQAALAIRNASLFAAEGAARQAAERALAEVTRLQGMLPICSYCKKIRNDQNSWEQMESYISEHSHATFSHGICPDCRSTVVARELEQWQRAR
jgi:GAF domain-containing protein